MRVHRLVALGCLHLALACRGGVSQEPTDDSMDADDDSGTSGDADFFAPVIEPAGGVVLTSRPWNSRAMSELDTANSEGWSAAGEGQSSNLGIVSDLDSPTSSGNLLRTTYPVGFADGSSPCYPGPQYSAGFATAYRGLYYRAAIRPSAQFRGQASVTKICFMWCGASGPGSGSNDFFGRLGGVGTTSPLTLTLNTQNRFGGARSWTRNVGSVGDDEVLRGEWNLIEYYIRFETAEGNSDAIVRAAVNGRQIIEITNERFLKAGESSVVWTMFTLDRTWGGEDSETVATAFHYDEDHTVLIGVP